MEKKFFLVFEGMDGTGKTSLAEMVAKIINVSYEHNDKCSSYEDGKIKAYNYMNNLDVKEECVIDRLVHTGEAVYAPIYRGYDGSDYFEDLEKRMLEKCDMFIVYVTADEEVIKNRLESRGEDYINPDDIKKIQANYEKYLNKTEIPYIIYDNSKDGILDNAVELIKTVTDKILEEGTLC